MYHPQSIQSHKVVQAQDTQWGEHVEISSELGWDQAFTTKYDGMCNFVLPHASVCQPLLAPEATNGSGSAKVWRLCTPAMAAGVTNHVWSLKEVLLYRVPPWPQPQPV